MNTAQESHNPFVICKAAAGSGKTFTLVKEFLTLAMDVGSEAVRNDPERFEHELEVRYRGILAITFTKKATGEMKERILKCLREISLNGIDPKLSPMGAALLERLNGLRCYARRPVDEEELRWMAGVVHRAVLHNYSDLSVSTIDSFMHRVVRTFAHDLGKPVGFDVSVDQSDFVIHAIDRLMAQLGTEGNEKLTDVAVAFAESNMEEGVRYNIEGDLKRLAGQLFAEGTDRYLDAVSGLEPADFMAIHDHLVAENRSYEGRVRGCAARMTELLNGLSDSPDDFAGGAKGYYSFFRTLAADGPLRPLTKTAAANLDQERYTSAKCSRDTADRIAAAADAIQEIYGEVRELLGVDSGSEMDRSTALRDYFTRKALLVNIFPLALLGRLDAELKAYAGENEVMHLSEFNKLINEVVSEQPAPFIYERLGNRYHHYLIDEFQDTSVLQWHNLLPLVENGVSQMSESLVVGDGKQAIYRFRQGDVRQFVSLPHVDGAGVHGQLLEQPGYWREDPLSTNYRTAASVVRFNNRFFTWLVQQPPFSSNKLVQKIYIGRDGDVGHPELEQQVSPRKEGVTGHVGVAFVDRDDRDAMYEQVCQTIVRLVGQQGYSQKDIMILCRTKIELARVSNYLQAHGEDMEIRVTSAESFFLVRSHAVMALVAALRLLHDGADRVAAADLLQRLVNLGLAASAHHEAFLGRGPVDVDGLLRAEGRGLTFDADALSRLGLYECCEELVRQLHLDGIDVAYVASFLSYVAEFVGKNHEGIGPFLDWFDDNATYDTSDSTHKHLSAMSSENVDAVCLMTIHKAKGLEAPVVILPLGPWSTKGFSRWVDLGSAVTVEGRTLPVSMVKLTRDQSTAFDAERDEEVCMDEVDRINMLYVAFTRPVEQLFVICPTPSEKSKGEGINFPRLIKQFMDTQQPDTGDAGFRHVAKSEVDGEGDGPVSVALQGLSFPTWKGRVKVASKSEKVLDARVEEKIRFGNLAHALLADLADADDVDAAVERLRAAETVDDDTLRSLAVIARKTVSHPDTARFFAKGLKVKNECELCDEKGLCRPDRVVFAEDETWVVDFKTGADEGGEHDEQVRRYCAAVGAMGFPAVGGWLVYLLPEIHVRRVC